jgi:nucleoside-diphosphate-sugar epimerase
MRILVIGGTRFMGPYVVQALHDAGHEVAVFHRGQTPGALPAEVRSMQGNRQQLPQYAKELQAFVPEIVLDMIAMVEEDAQEAADLFTGIARRVVTLSSQDVYRAFGRVNFKESGPADPLPITEDSPLRENLYPYRGTPVASKDEGRWRDNYDKILVERVVMGNSQLPGTILRLPAVYGPGDHQHRMSFYIKHMDDGRPAVLMDEAEARWRWTHGYVENVAHAITLAVLNDRAAGRIYNVSEPFTLSMEERVQRIGEATGWQGKIVLAPAGFLPKPLRIGINTTQDVVVDSSRIRRELGYAERVPTDVAMNRTIVWERAHPPQAINPKDYDYQAEDNLLAAL